MHAVLDTKRLTDGTRADIVRVEAPDTDYRTGILDLLAHKGGAWDLHLRLALDGDTDLLETRWYLAVVGGVPVANAMTVERHGVGILGHVFTKEAYRQKGLCRSVLAHLMADFVERAGKVLLLGTEEGSVAYRIYESVGFRPIRGGFMQYLSPKHPAFDETWFAPGSAQVSRACWQHWPLVNMLGARREGGGLRSLAWGLHDIGNLERAYCFFMQQVLEGQADGTVAVTPTGAVVACATVTPFRAGWSEHVWPGLWIVDAFSHPLHEFKLDAALASLRRRPGKEIAIVPKSKDAKVAAFVNAGFAVEGTLRGFIQQQGVSSDALILGRFGSAS